MYPLIQRCIIKPLTPCVYKSDVVSQFFVIFNVISIVVIMNPKPLYYKDSVSDFVVT